MRTDAIVGVEGTVHLHGRAEPSAWMDASSVGEETV